MSFRRHLLDPERHLLGLGIGGCGGESSIEGWQH